MLYLLDKLVRAKHLKLCERCGLKYDYTASECPHCSHISDSELKHLLTKRAGVRLGLGKVMWVGALLLVIIMLLVKL